MKLKQATPTCFALLAAGLMFVLIYCAKPAGNAPPPSAERLPQGFDPRDPETQDGFLNLGTPEEDRNGGPERGLREDFSTGTILTSLNLDDGARAVMWLNDGKVLIGGYSFGATTNRDFGLARFNPDGSLDNSFNGTGKNQIDLLGNNYDNIVHAIGTDSKGRIVAVGRSHTGLPKGNFNFAVARLKTDGTLDTTGFGSGGVVITPVTSFNNLARALAIQTDDKIVAIGYAATSAGHFNYDIAAVRYNTNGTLDTSFNGTGIVTTPITSGRDDVAYGGAIDNNGKIIAGGYTLISDYRFALVRYNTDGTLDASFGSSGIVTTDMAANATDLINGVAVQSDNKIIVTGYAWNGTNFDFALARYATNGTLDSTFGTSASGRKLVAIGSSDDMSRGIAVQNDGRILVSGQSYNGTQNVLAVARLTTAGAIDSSFGTSGAATFTLGSDGSAEAVAFDAGKIVAAGRALNSLTRNRIALLRLNIDGTVASSGTVDKSFNSTGVVRTSFGASTDEIRAIALQTDGKIVAAGRSRNPSGNFDYLLSRFNTDGSIDTTLGTTGAGYSISSFSTADDEGNSVVIQADGKIIVGGRQSGNFGFARYTTTGVVDSNFSINVGSNPEEGRALLLQTDGSPIMAGFANNDFEVVRVNTALTTDASFGTGGIARAAVSATTDQAFALALQADGRSVAAGRALSSAGNYDFTTVRFTTGGNLDTTFGGGTGIVVTTIAPTNSDEAYGAVVQPDQKIVTAGFAHINDEDFAVVRLLTDGTLDTSFGGDGIVTTSVGTSNEQAQALTQQPNGKLIAAGYSMGGAPARRHYAMIRYNSDGSLDTTFNLTGIVSASLQSGNESWQTVILQPDGRILAGGFSSQNNKPTNPAIYRYWP